MHNEHFEAAVWSERLARWVTVWLRPEAHPGEGSFTLSVDTYAAGTGAALPVALYQPGRDGTHTPLGPHELEEAGLRDVAPGSEAFGT